MRLVRFIKNLFGPTSAYLTVTRNGRDLSALLQTACSDLQTRSGHFAFLVHVGLRCHYQR
jgi:hypothetical protein